MGLWDLVEDTASSVWDAGSAAVDTVGEWTSSAVDTVSDWSSSAVDTVSDWGGSTLDTAMDLGSSAFGTAVDWGSSALDTAVDLGSSALDTAMDLGSSALDTASEWGGPAIDAIRDVGSAIDSAVFGERIELTEEQRQVLQDLHGEGLNLDEVTLRRGGLFSLDDTPRGVGNTIALTDDCFDEEGHITPLGMETLVHESVHTSQYQNAGFSYAVDALLHQARAAQATGTRNAAYRYDTSTPWEQLNAEQQASAIEDRWRSQQLTSSPEHRAYYEQQIEAARATGDQGRADYLEWQMIRAPLVNADPNLAAYQEQLRSGEGMARLTEEDLGPQEYQRVTTLHPATAAR